MRDLSQGQDWLIVASLERPEYDEYQRQQRVRAFFESATNARLPYKVVTGYWEGNFEVSFVMPLDAFPSVSHHFTNQDALLVLAPDGGDGRLAYLTDASLANGKHIGKWHAVDMATALAASAYTYDGETSAYYAVTPMGRIYDGDPDAIAHVREAVGRARRVTTHAATRTRRHDPLDDILLIENGTPSREEYVGAFQRLIDDGLVWSLQGFYGREATRLIQAGECRLPGRAIGTHA